MKFPIAVQLYSVRDDMGADPIATLQKIKDMGYDGVEFAGLAGLTAAEMKATCEKIGLTPISAHVGIDDLKKEGVLGEVDQNVTTAREGTANAGAECFKAFSVVAELMSEIEVEVGMLFFNVAIE